ncbi:hypothetical protein F5B19DRAFT_81463 [Rostrohypoxylon terebratum]|nr:hypothetical protein F5B19DRAFT_81463 [Rostrohypoxylon terebratum]
MVATVSVAYKAGKFDMEYYLKTHMPLVQKTWAPFGLKSWKVVQYTDPESPYAVQALLEWDDLAQWEKASTSAEAASVFGDITNFTDVKPDKLQGTVVGGASC